MLGDRANEYQLVLRPHADLRNKIMKVKAEFAEKFHCDQAKWGKVHIMLVSFTQLEIMEGKIVNRLKTIAMGHAPFKIELKDFGSYPAHTIYINIDSKFQVKNVIRELKAAQKLMTINKDNKPHFLDDPHVHIAGKLLPWQYEKGWKEFSQRQFSGRFVADGMLLVKRAFGEKAYQIVGRFGFMNLPINTKQGELFGK